MGKEIGIDFGTTNTVVSYVNKKGRLRQLRFDGSTLIPSVVYFKTKNEPIIGKKAKKLMELNKNQAGIASFKPKIGDKDFKYEVVAENGDEFKIKPRKVATIFLQAIIKSIQDKLVLEFGAIEGCIDKTVLTVPAKFSSTDKESTRKAAKAAGFDMTKLAAEPTAAAIAYKSDLGDDNGDDDNDAILVYDFGGGTFDVSVIQRQRGTFREIATGGDKELGGNKLTSKLEELLLEKINDKYKLDMPLDEEEFFEDDNGINEEQYKKNISSIHDAANTIKEDLSDEESVMQPINILLPGDKNEVFETEVKREELEDCIRDDIEHSVEITKKIIEEAKAKDVEIGQIVLAGGSSNIPMVKEMLDEQLQQENIVYSDDVSTMISRGAAILAQKLDNIDDVTQQLTNVQLGVAATEGMQFKKFQVIIPENTPLPCRRKRTFSLAKDGQRRLEIAYYEYDVKNYPGAVRVDEDGISEVDTLIIDNLPPDLDRDNTNVVVEFIAQKDGSLDINVDIEDKAGNKMKSDSLSISKGSDLE